MENAGRAHSHTELGSFAESTTEGLRALRIGIAGLAATTILQGVILLFSGSVALLGDTLHNGVDVAGTGVVWAAFILSRRSRSERFTFGYHRFEDLAGLVVVVLIAASAALVLYEAGHALGGSAEIARPWLVLAAGAIGFAGNEGVAQFKIRTGRRIGSAALEADGRHSRADGLTSLGVVAAAIGSLAGARWLDAAVGAGIGVLIAWTAYQAGRAVLMRLLDTADPALRESLIATAQSVAAIDHINDLRMRQAGRTVHVVASVCMAAATPLDQAHAAAEELRHTWLHDLPTGSTVDIHIDPYTPGDIHAYHHGPEQEAHT